jgi:hypothetical protein
VFSYNPHIISNSFEAFINFQGEIPYDLFNIEFMDWDVRNRRKGVFLRKAGTKWLGNSGENTRFVFGK